MGTVQRCALKWRMLRFLSGVSIQRAWALIPRKRGGPARTHRENSTMERNQQMVQGRGRNWEFREFREKLFTETDSFQFLCFLPKSETDLWGFCAPVGAEPPRAKERKPHLRAPWREAQPSSVLRTPPTPILVHLGSQDEKVLVANNCQGFQII